MPIELNNTQSLIIILETKIQFKYVYFIEQTKAGLTKIIYTISGSSKS